MPRALVARDLPREQARRQRVDLVAAVRVAVGHKEGEHGLVLARGVVDEREAVGDRLLDHARRLPFLSGAALAALEPKNLVLQPAT